MSSSDTNPLLLLQALACPGQTVMLPCTAVSGLLLLQWSPARHSHFSPALPPPLQGTGIGSLIVCTIPRLVPWPLSCAVVENCSRACGSFNRRAKLIVSLSHRNGKVTWLFAAWPSLAGLVEHRHHNQTQLSAAPGRKLLIAYSFAEHTIKPLGRKVCCLP